MTLKKLLFENCVCPKCGKSLSDVLVEEKLCPHCLENLNAREVWLTKRHPGQLQLPVYIAENKLATFIILLGLLYFAFGILQGSFPIVTSGFLIFIGMALISLNKMLDV